MGALLPLKVAGVGVSRAPGASWFGWHGSVGAKHSGQWGQCRGCCIGSPGRPRSFSPLSCQAQAAYLALVGDVHLPPELPLGTPLGGDQQGGLALGQEPQQLRLQILHHALGLWAIESLQQPPGPWHPRRPEKVGSDSALFRATKPSQQHFIVQVTMGVQGEPGMSCCLALHRR